MTTSPRPKTTSVQRYFDRKAAHYVQTSGNRWWTAVKHKEQQAIFRLLDPRPQDAILDAGCGDGYYLAELVRRGCRAEGLDLSPQMVAEVRRRGLTAQEANLEDTLPGGSGRFDKVLCAGVFEFCNQPRLALANLRAAIKPHGDIILFLPRRSFSGWIYRLFHRFFGCGVTVSLFSPGEIRRMAESCRLELTAVEPATSFSMALKLRNREPVPTSS